MTTSDISVRPLAGDDDLSLFLTLDGPSFGPPGRDFMTVVADGHYRGGWTWVAQRGGRVVARAAWWGGPDDEHPLALDWFDLAPDLDDRVAVGATLLRTASEVMRTAEGGLPEYHLFLPPDWRQRPAVRDPAEERIEAAGRAGLQPFVERLRVEWRRTAGPSTGAAASATAAPAATRTTDGTDRGSGDTTQPLSGPNDRLGRLVLTPVPSDAELRRVLERVAEGTLDAYTRRDAARADIATAAQAQLDTMQWMPAPQDWWRLAHTADGALVGLVMPSRNYEVAVIGYLGVVPEQRGHGYAGELLAWATQFLADQGEARIVADTDTGNTPVAAAFAQAGYAVISHRIVMA